MLGSVRGFAAAVLLVGAGGPVAAQAQTFDFGDAPSSGAAGYETALGAQAGFPTTAATSGPRHIGGGQLRLGLAWSAEAAPRLIDADGDDGMSLRRLNPCGTSQIVVLVDASRIPRAQRRTGGFTLNGWFDWSRDGTWDDAGCAVEWAIQNLRVPFSTLGANGIGLVPVSFRAGEQVSEFWYRMTVTTDAVPPAFSGAIAAPLSAGETEDARHRAPDAVVLPKLRIGGGGSKRGRDWNVRCNPNPLEMRHGETRRVTFDVDPKPADGGTIDVSRTSPRSDRFRIEMHRTGKVPGRRTASFVDGFDFESTRVHSPTKKKDLVEKRAVKFRFRKDGRVQDLTCRVLVLHERAIRLIFAGDPKLPPAVALPPGPAPDGGPPDGGAGGDDAAPAAPDLRWTFHPFSWRAGASVESYDAVATTEHGAVVVGTKTIEGVKRLAVAHLDTEGQRRPCGDDGDYEGQQVSAVRDVEVAGDSAFVLVETQSEQATSQIIDLGLGTCMADGAPADVNAGPGDSQLFDLAIRGDGICATGRYVDEAETHLLLACLRPLEPPLVHVGPPQPGILGTAISVGPEGLVTVGGMYSGGAAFLAQFSSAGSGAGLLDGDGFVGPFATSEGSDQPVAVPLTNGGQQITPLGIAYDGTAFGSFATVVGANGVTLTPAQDANFVAGAQEGVVGAAATGPNNVLVLGQADIDNSWRFFSVNLRPTPFAKSTPQILDAEILTVIDVAIDDYEKEVASVRRAVALTRVGNNLRQIGLAAFE